MSKLQRRLAAIMFTDIVGYTAMMQQDEVIANRKRRRHRTVFNELTPQYDGQILQYYGDGTLSIFNSTTAAVECAVAIQRALKKEPKVSLRIGIHTGDVTFNEEDIFGDGVNVASRIESLCVPGGVYISRKVYDDIKNHPTLKAQYIGDFDLKNISEKTTVYAISNNGITIPEKTFPDTFNTPEIETASKNKVALMGAKNKLTAALLALAFGIFGAHRFYLGNRGLGIAYLSVGGVGIFTGINFLIAGIAIISFIDALLLFVSPTIEFDQKYNKGTSIKQKRTGKKEASPVSQQKSLLKAKFERHKQDATHHFKNHEYREAIQTLDKALEIKYDDKKVHFLLAKCYSMLEINKKSLFHLDAAVAFGLPIKKAKFDYALAHLRVSPEYRAFAENGYRILEVDIFLSESEASSDLLSSSPNLLEQLKKLQELRNRGFLTEEEYLEQKKRMEKS